MPETLRSVVCRWIEESGEAVGGTEGMIDVLCIHGGPGGCSYLDADGEVWDWSVWDESITRVEDGPLKVGAIAVAAEHRPELAEWLPRRPTEAVDCSGCEGSGWLPPPFPHVLCPQCVGLGWREPNGVEECDFWWFRELYGTLAAFADDPSTTISRIGGGQFPIAEDQAEDLGCFRRCILAKYPEAGALRVMQVVAEIEAILDRKSRGGEEFEEWFWTNDGFRRHPDWVRIREMSRSFLLR